MKNKYSLYLFVILAIGTSCSHIKTNQAEHCPLDSIVVDFYKYKGEKPDSLPNGYLPYPLLGITCATLQDVVNKYGECTNIEVSKDVDLTCYHDYYPFEVISVILQNYKCKVVDIYCFTFEPYANPDLYLNVYFINYFGELRVVFGERLNSKVHIME